MPKGGGGISRADKKGGKGKPYKKGKQTSLRSSGAPKGPRRKTGKK